MLILFIFLLISVPQSTALDKMMKVFGRVSTVEYTSPFDVTPECVKLCYNSEECILAYLDAEGSCQNYRYKLDDVTMSVLETSEDEGHTVVFKKMVAISDPFKLGPVHFEARYGLPKFENYTLVDKFFTASPRIQIGENVRNGSTTLPDSTCPAYENLRFSKVANDGTSYSWRKTLDGWKFERCATGSMQSERNGVTVCIIPYYTTGEKSVVTSYCSYWNGGRFFGLESEKEISVFYQDLKINPDARSGTRGFFIDGMRNCPDGISCTNFVWSDGLTNGSALLSSSNAMIRNTTSTANDNNCLAVVYSSATSSGIIVDVSCDTMDMIGVACGYELE